MCLKPQPLAPVPEETRLIAQQIYLPDHLLRRLGDEYADDGADYSLIMDKYYQDKYYQPNRYHWDDQAKAPYPSSDAPASKDRKFISYNDAKLCALTIAYVNKIAYVKQQGLRGVIIWDLGGGYRASQPEGQKDTLMQAVKKAWITP